MSATSREFAAKRHKRNSEFQIWTHENHAVEFITNKFIDQKLNYIYENPVRAGIVYKAEDYMYSSASNYILGEGIINVKILEWNQRFRYTATESETLPNGRLSSQGRTKWTFTSSSLLYILIFSVKYCQQVYEIIGQVCVEKAIFLYSRLLVALSP